MDLFILAEGPRSGDTVITALPRPGSNDGTAVIPLPTPRKPGG
jgi:hypothetical protein